jgi:hypothetical protein
MKGLGDVAELKRLLLKMEPLSAIASLATVDETEKCRDYGTLSADYILFSSNEL